MPKVRLSGLIKNAKDESRKVRAKLLYRLFYAGFDIYNGNGDQVVSLDNIQEKIIESDAFVFTPGATLEDMFKAVSIFVGHQTQDADLANKPCIIVNKDGSWNGFMTLIEHLNRLGTVKQHFTDYVTLTRNVKDAITALSDTDFTKEKPEPPKPSKPVEALTSSPANVPDKSICVFCSASIKDEAYIEEGVKLGNMIALGNYGCVSGAGKTGIMGAVVKGANEAGGWSAGSNVPHIIALEGLPEGLDSFWPRPDIYTRMEVMLEASDAFVIMPGGCGTVQELLALIILKLQENDIMHKKPIVIFNKKDPETKLNFWEPLLNMLSRYNVRDHVEVVTELEDIIPTIEKTWAQLKVAA